MITTEEGAWVVAGEEWVVGVAWVEGMGGGGADKGKGVLKTTGGTVDNMGMGSSKAMGEVREGDRIA